MALICHKPLTR